MIASEIIGLTAVLLVLIFFYSRKFFHKLRGLFILILAFASAGLVGYSSASSIGVGWTVSLALLIFLGVAVTVIYLHKREDRLVEEQFELALKSEQTILAQAEAAVPDPRPFLAADTDLSITASERMLLGTFGHERADDDQASQLDAPEQAVPLFPSEETDYSFREEKTDAEVSEAALESAGEATGKADAEWVEAERADISVGIDGATGRELVAVAAEDVERIGDLPDDAAPVADEPLAPAANASESEAHQAPAAPPAMPATSLTAAQETDSQGGNPPSPPIEKASRPEHRERIQTLSADAEQALQRGDFLRAYQSLREALTFPAPPTAAYILGRQLVQVLNEMGLYEESISVIEKVLREHPSLSAKKQKKFTWQISYLEELVRQLQAENKRNLSWSLVPPVIHQKVSAHFRSLFADSEEQPSAIPFH